jgi:hypothetical protein
MNVSNLNRLWVHAPLLLVGAVLLVTGTLLGLELARLVFADGNFSIQSLQPGPFFLAQLSHGLAFFRTLLCVLLVLVVRPRAAEASDAALQSALFLTLLLADYWIILGDELLRGVALYLFVQLGWTVRHSRGISSILKMRSNRTRDSQLSVIKRFTFLILLIWMAAMSILIHPMIEKNLISVMLPYSGVLAVSLLAALVSRSIGHFSRPRATAIALGMVLFVCCDLTVGAGAAFKGTAVGAIADALTGLFYGPALLLFIASLYPNPWQLLVATLPAGELPLKPAHRGESLR